jgi:hypothetical protein
MQCDLRIYVEPPWGVEPQTYALRGNSMSALSAPPAPIARLTALPALTSLRKR